MTNGRLTEEQIMIRDVARDFAMNEVLPLANKLDPERGDMPDSLIARMGELGFFGILIPEEYGGLGLGCLEYCLVAEELARGWMSVASIVARGNAVYHSIGGSPAERRERIERMARGEYLGAFAMSEPNAGSDVASITTRARKVDGGWRITGNKYWCTFADRADYITVIARTSEGSARHQGLSAIALPKPRGEFPQGVSGAPIPKIGYFGWRTYELAFDDVFAPDDALVSEEGRAFAWVARELEVARAHTAARSIGLARGALEDAVAYAAERRQFDQPIANFQSVRFKIATMATEIEAARQLLHHVCTEIDSGRRCDKEAAMVKYFAAEMAERVTSEALQILGGAGYTTLHAVERYWRDARLTKIFEGSSEIQQRIISDAILGKPVAPAA